MAKGKFQSADAYEADVLALLERAEKNLTPEEFVEMLDSLSQTIDHKHDEVVNDMRQNEVDEIEQDNTETDWTGSSAPWGN